jgi:hypothetical protein
MLHDHERTKKENKAKKGVWNDRERERSKEQREKRLEKGAIL